MFSSVSAASAQPLPQAPAAPSRPIPPAVPTTEALDAAVFAADTAPRLKLANGLAIPSVSFDVADEQDYKLHDPRFEPRELSKGEMLDQVREGLREAVGPVAAPVIEGVVGAGALAGSKKFGLSTGVEQIAPGAKLGFDVSYKKIKLDDAMRLNIPIQDRPRELKAMISLRVPLGGKQPQ